MPMRAGRLFQPTGAQAQGHVLAVLQQCGQAFRPQAPHFGADKEQIAALRPRCRPVAPLHRAVASSRLQPLQLRPGVLQGGPAGLRQGPISTDTHPAAFRQTPPRPVEEVQLGGFGPGIQMFPHQRRRQRPAAGLAGIGLLFVVDAGGAGVGPPVIEHPGDMPDFFAPLRDPERQVIVLGAVTVRIQAAHLLKKPPPQHKEVHEVIVRAQKLPVERALEERIQGPALQIDQALVAVERIRLFRVDHARHLIQGIGRQLVVMIQKGQPLALRQFGRPVGGCGNTAVLRHGRHPDARIQPGIPGQQRRDMGLGAAVVHQTELPVGPGLHQHRMHAAPELVFAGIVHRGQNTDAGPLPPGQRRHLGAGIAALVQPLPQIVQ